MANLFPGYTRESFFGTVRANGFNLTPAEEERAHNMIISESRGTGIGDMLMNAVAAGARLFQAFIDFGSSKPLMERLNEALNTADRFSPQRNVNEVMNRLRDSFQDMGGNIAAAASAMTGDTSAGQGIMRGNLRDVAMAPLQPTAEELRRGTRLDVGSQGPQPARYAVVDTSEIAAPQTPSATRALTGYVQGA